MYRHQKKCVACAVFLFFNLSIIDIISRFNLRLVVACLRWSRMASVCVLGLGKMGSAICRRLRSQGLNLVVWNRTFQKAQLLTQEEGPPAIAKASLEDAISSLTPNGLILSVMSDTPALLELLANPALMKGLSGRVLANLASANPDEGRDLAKSMVGLGAAGYLDCAYCGPPHQVLAGFFLPV